MAEISVQELGPGRYEVTVRDQVDTTHEVTLAEAYREEIAGPEASPTTLIERSFEFLLEREPNTMILSRFDLPVIERYFPEFETEIRQRL